MKQNVCDLDRTMRLVSGIALLVFALRPDGEREGDVSLRRILAGYGAAELLLINGTLQWCPVNYALGIDTCEADWPERIARLFGREPATAAEGENGWAEVPVQ